MDLNRSPLSIFHHDHRLPHMRILIVGNGGREHALLWKLRRDAPTASFFATQANGGMASDCESVDIQATDVESLSKWATSNRIDLSVVGPEVPLSLGIVDPVSYTHLTLPTICSV